MAIDSKEDRLNREFGLWSSLDHEPPKSKPKIWLEKCKNKPKAWLKKLSKSKPTHPKVIRKAPPPTKTISATIDPTKRYDDWIFPLPKLEERTNWGQSKQMSEFLHNLNRVHSPELIEAIKKLSTPSELLVKLPVN